MSSNHTRLLLPSGRSVCKILRRIASDGSAQGTPACLTDQEARALFAYAIPEALTGVAKTCRASLPSSSFLATRSAATIAEFRAAAAGSWPTAKAAFLKIAGADAEAEVIALMSDAALQPFVAEAFAGVVAKDVNVADCP